MQSVHNGSIRLTLNWRKNHSDCGFLVDTTIHFLQAVCIHDILLRSREVVQILVQGEESWLRSPQTRKLCKRIPTVSIATNVKSP